LPDSAFRADLDTTYLTSIKLAERIPEWTNICKKHSGVGEEV
jgi:hypothetical protein